MFEVSLRKPKIRSTFLALTLSLGVGALVTSNSACSLALGKNVDQCSVNSDCNQYNGTNLICRKSDHTCQSLTSPECPYAYSSDQNGSLTNDNAIYMGLIISLSGSYGSGYKTYEAAARTALDDFQKVGALLPPSAASGGNPRPLVAIECDDASSEQDDNHTVLASAHHLVDDVGVQAIIGTPSTNTTVAIANSVTIPAGVFLISPSATGSNITSLSDNNLVWRTCPSDTYQGLALATYLRDVLIPQVRQKNNIPAGGVKILSFFRGDVYGEGLEAIFKASDAFTNGIKTETFKEFNYGSSDGSPTNTDVQQQLANFAPNIVLAFGLGEVAFNVIKQTEDNWTAEEGSAPRPYYVATDGIVTDDPTKSIAGVVKAKGGDLYKRVVYSTAASTTTTVLNRYNDAIGNFVRGNYLQNEQAGILGPDDTLGAPGTYDSVYILGYAITSATAQGRAATARGADIARAMANLTNGAAADLWRVDLPSAEATLNSGGTVKINGASSPLNFDLKTGDVVTDISFECISSTGAQTDSGLVYQSTPQTMGGSFNPSACGYTP